MPSSIGLLLQLIFAARIVFAAAIPSTVSMPAGTGLASTSPFSSLLSSGFSSQSPVTQGVAQQQPQTGQNYALDPFGFLGSTGGVGNAGDGIQQTRQTLTSKASSNTASAPISKTNSVGNTGFSTSTSRTGSASKTGSLIAPATGASAASQSTKVTPIATSSTSSIVTPSHASNKTGSDASSGSSMNSWKVIGIGVLVFAGVVLLVLGTAFQDTITRGITRPFRNRKADGEEVLVPDWRRGSWRFGEDDVGTEKVGFGEDDGPHNDAGEKGNSGFTPPPLSPFPLRRTPSANVRVPPPVEPGIAGVGAGATNIVKTDINGTCILPSPPPPLPAAHTPQPLQEYTSAKARRFSSPRARPNSDAYGGME